MQLLARQVMRALAAVGGPPIEDDTVKWLTSRGVLMAAPVGRRGLYARTEVFILRAALELTQLGVTAGHLSGVAMVLREILTAGDEYGLSDPDHVVGAEQSILSHSEQYLLDQLLQRTAGRGRDTAAADVYTRIRAWCAFERARVSGASALVLFWFAQSDETVEWQIRTDGETIHGPFRTIAPPQRRAYLALEWANVARGL